jgi:hypothetical protein
MAKKGKGKKGKKGKKSPKENKTGAKFSKDQLKEVKSWVKFLDGVTIEDLKAKLKTYCGLPEYKSLKGGDLGTAVFKRLRAEIGATFDAGAQPFEVLVLECSKPSIITNKNKEKMKMSNLKLIFVPGEGYEKPPTEEPFYANIGLFDEDTELYKKVKPGQGYTAHLKARWENGAWKNVSANKNTAQFTEMDAEFPPVKDILDARYPMIECADVDVHNISKHRGDLKLVMGNIIFCDTPKRREGKGRYGIITLIDDSNCDPKDLKQKGGLKIYCDAHQVRYEVGSDVMVLINIRKRREGGVSVNGEVIVPIIPIPRAVPQDDDEEEEEEESEEEEEEEEEEESEDEEEDEEEEETDDEEDEDDSEEDEEEEKSDDDEEDDDELDMDGLDD